MAATSYFYSLLILYVFGILSAIWRLIKKDTCSPLQIVSIFSVIGLMIYVCIFEANNRQLYNHMPWFVLGAVGGLEGIVVLLNRIFRRETNDE